MRYIISVLVLFCFSFVKAETNDVVRKMSSAINLWNEYMNNPENVNEDEVYSYIGSIVNNITIDNTLSDSIIYYYHYLSIETDEYWDSNKDVVPQRLLDHCYAAKQLRETSKQLGVFSYEYTDILSTLGFLYEKTSLDYARIFYEKAYTVGYLTLNSKNERYIYTKKKILNDLYSIYKKLGWSEYVEEIKSKIDFERIKEIKQIEDETDQTVKNKRNEWKTSVKYSDDYFDLSYDLLQMYMLSDKNKYAKQILEDGAEIYEGLKNNNSTYQRLKETVLESLVSYTDIHNLYDKQVYYCHEYLKLIGQCYGKNSVMYGYGLIYCVTSHIKNMQLKEAESDLKIAEKISGWENRDRVLLCHNKGRIYQLKGKNKEALSAYNEAVSLSEGKPLPKTILYMNEILIKGN